MSRRAKRERAKERRRERKAQAQADAEVREDWLAAIHGDPEDLELLAGESVESAQARAAVLSTSEIPDGVTSAMLRAACRRAIDV